MYNPRATADIRPAAIHDATAIATTHVASWRATYHGLVPQPYLNSLDIEEFAQRWQERLAQSSGMLIQVAEQAGIVCGFAAGGANRGTVPGFAGELYALYLLPSAQRQGLGTQLFWSAASALVKLGHESTVVWVLAQNPSRRFYERMEGTLCGEATIEIGGEQLTEAAYGWPDLPALLRVRAPSF